MALPSIMRKLFRNDGYGPLLKPEIIPFASDLASNAADAAASTKWVKDLAATPIYLDPAGSDSNGGMSSADAVQSFSKALEIASALPQHRFVFNVAGGTYSGDFSFSGRKILLGFFGNVTINGTIGVADGSQVIAINSGNTSNTLSINGGVLVADSSSFDLRVATNITRNAAHCIYCGDNSLFRIREDMNIYCSNSSIAVEVLRSASIIIDKTFTVHPNAVGTSIYVHYSGLFIVNSSGSASVSGDNGKCGVGVFVTDNAFYLGFNLSVDNSATDSCVSVAYSSTCLLSGTNRFYLGGSSAIAPIGVSYGATLVFCANSVNTVTAAQGSSRTIIISYSSRVVCSPNVTLNLYLYTGVAVFDIHAGYFNMYSGKLDIGGTVTTGTAVLGAASVFDLRSDVTVSGNVSGRRYAVSHNSTCFVNGSGVNRIPGSTAGIVDSSSYYG